ncbi:hypothetical protein ACLOJK_002294 [Asimina triloba]
MDRVNYIPARIDLTQALGLRVKLEDPNSSEVKDFVKKQADLTEGLLQKCDTREKIRNQITKLFDHPRYDTPFKRGGKYFYFHNRGLQAQSVLYVQEGLEEKAEVLLDPNNLSEDGTVALRAASISEDAKFLAYGLSSSGSDWVTIKVMRIEDKSVEPDLLSWVKFSGISWTHDSEGFFYSRYPAPKEGGKLDAGMETNINLNQEVYYHFLGTDQSQDILCWRDTKHPQWMFDARVTEDGKYVILCIEESCKPVNKLYYCDLSMLPHGLKGYREKGMLPFVKLVDTFEACYFTVSNDGSEFTFLTNKDAPKYKLVRVDLNEPAIWTDVIPEAEKDVLESARAVNGNQLLVSYLSDVKYIVQIRDLKTGVLQHDLPVEIGTVYGISGRRKDNMVFIGFTSFLTPGIIYQCNLATEVPVMKIFREIVVPEFDRTEFQVNQVFVPSKDGTNIPMFIVSKKNIPLDRSNPCLLYGYGGFGSNLTPTFSVNRVILVRHLGLVFSIANIRGGGEYGEDWHKAGSLSKKQNSFDDFVSSAEYLVSAGYTQPKKLCIEGGSNGGLLVAACVNQRPDLFGCALAHVGVMDMLRFHKFTIGEASSSGPACCAVSNKMAALTVMHGFLNMVVLTKRRNFIGSSALPSEGFCSFDQVGDGGCPFQQYPAMMLLTADHDDRVVPLHSLKLLATMQYLLCTSLENSFQRNPIIAHIDRKAGHGAGRPTQKLINEAADRYSFMAKMLGLSWVY